MNIQNTDSYEYRKLIGQIKFSFIAPVVSRTFIDDSISAYFKRVSETEIDWPDGTKRRFSDQTMKWWLHIYRKYGFEGLMPKDRLDLGRVRKLDDDHKRYIADLIGQYPKITGVMIYEKMIEPAAAYSFNKSHSVCYAMIAYQTAYLKAYYPVEFYASLIRSVEEDTDELSTYVYEAQNQGITVGAPDINRSFNHVAALGNEIRLGFFCIKGLGLEIGEVIQKERETNGQYTTLEDFIKRCAPIINKKLTEGLIKSGAFDAFGDRGILLANSETILEWAKKSKNDGGGLFGMMEMSTKITFKPGPTTSMMERLMLEYEVFKVFVSGNPLDGLYTYIKRYNFISQFKEKENFGSLVIIGYIKNIQRAKKKGFFIQIEDISGTTEIFVRELLDFKKFDILMIIGFKGRSISIEKIVKVSRDQLIRQAGSKYDPEMTVVKAKSLRGQPSTRENTTDIEAQKEEVMAEEVSPTSPYQQTTFTLPDSTQKINEIIIIIQTHKGDQEIRIGNKDFLLNEEGIQKIHDLLSK
ncbi:MAG TPA: hypothetical protein PKC87_04620 [Candidatus Absconditabacterales bacterium]|nr:hypothetical protein [Candidatus Absconditabacterales bacterium]